MNVPHESRIPALDGLRGIAILLVMQYHFWGLAFGLSGQLNTSGLDGAIEDVSSIGWSGVDLFFVLSGFLITGILFDAKNGDSFFRAFYARRILRIVPVCYGFFIFILVVAPWLPTLSQVARVDEFRDIQLWFWTFNVNIASSIKPLDVEVPLVYSHLWSLSVEEQFYLLWPFVVFALGRRGLMGLCVVLVATAFLFRYALTAGFAEDFFQINAPGVLMPARMDTLALGAFIALALRGGELARLRRFAPAVVLISVATLAIIFSRNDGLSTFSIEVERYGYSAYAFLYAAILVIVLSSAGSTLWRRALTSPFLSAFGRYSYAMYIVHLLVGFWLANRFVKWDLTPTFGGSQVPTNILFSVVATIITFAIAWMSWRVVEQPFLRLKSRFAYRRDAGDNAREEEAPATAAAGVQ